MTVSNTIYRIKNNTKTKKKKRKELWKFCPKTQLLSTLISQMKTRLYAKRTTSDRLNHKLRMF